MLPTNQFYLSTLKYKDHSLYMLPHVCFRGGKEIPLGQPLKDTLLRVVSADGQTITEATGNLLIGSEAYFSFTDVS